MAEEGRNWSGTESFVSPMSPQTQPDQIQDIPSTLTIVTEKMTKMTDTEIDRAIELQRPDKELQMKDVNGKVIKNFTKNINWGEGGEEFVESNHETSELELLSNLSNQVLIKYRNQEQETKNRLTQVETSNKKTLIVRLNNPVLSDYRKNRQKTKHQGAKQQPGEQPGIRRPELANQHN